MPLELAINLVFAGLFIGSGVISIVLLFYIRRTRIKEIDKAIYGVEFGDDSIFFVAFRAPNYGGALLWKWYARIMGFEGKIEHFDKRFCRPFIAIFLLFDFGGFLIITMMIFIKYGII